MLTRAPTSQQARGSAPRQLSSSISASRPAPRGEAMGEARRSGEPRRGELAPVVVVLAHVVLL